MVVSLLELILIKKHFDIDIEINKIHQIKSFKKLTGESSKKSLCLINKISKTLLELELQENNSIKSKCLLSKKYCHQYETCKLVV